MTVAELRKALEGLPDDMLVLVDVGDWPYIISPDGHYLTQIGQIITPIKRDITGMFGLEDSASDKTVFVIS